MVEMALIVIALPTATSSSTPYDEVIAMGVLLGIAGASFGVALSLGSGWFPPQYKGLAMGIAGAGNSGTVLAVLFAPPLAQPSAGRRSMAWPLHDAAADAGDVVRREGAAGPRAPDLQQHIACLFEKDGWAFSLIYVVTFGGFIGLASFLPTYFYDQFGVTKVEAGQLTMLATLMGSAVRVVGGYDLRPHRRHQHADRRAGADRRVTLLLCGSRARR